MIYNAIADDTDIGAAREAFRDVPVWKPSNTPLHPRVDRTITDATVGIIFVVINGKHCWVMSGDPPLLCNRNRIVDFNSSRPLVDFDAVESIPIVAWEEKETLDWDPVADKVRVALEAYHESEDADT